MYELLGILSDMDNNSKQVQTIFITDKHACGELLVPRFSVL